MTSRGARVLCCLGLLAAGCRSDPDSHGAAPVPAQHGPDLELVRALTVLATGHAPPAAQLQSTAADIAAGRTSLPAYIDSLVASDAFANEIAPLIILRQLENQDGTGIIGLVLAHSDGPHPVYYLDQPCKPEQAIEVHPWWNLVENRDDLVRVCPDSYQPDRWSVERRGEPDTACLSDAGGTETRGCGCGPNLIRCFDSDARQAQFLSNLRDEPRFSIAHVVKADQPVETIFTSNGSFRNRDAELLLRAYAAESARKAIPEDMYRELAKWPAGGQWAGRSELAPGQHAGILTDSNVIHLQLDRRQRMTVIDDVIWCIEPDSVGATPQALLSIRGADLQFKSDGWRDLAARPICTNCHARLDYGMQFFWGYENGNRRAYFVPELQQHGTGKFYVNDIHDLRGEAALDPHSFAETAVAQPEFRHCMARDFAEYVFGDEVTAEEVANVEAAIRPNATTVRTLMRSALQALVAKWPLRPASEPDGSTGSPQREVAIAISPEQRKQLEPCMDCHDHEEGRPDLSQARLDRRTVVAMLEAVAFDAMPKEHPLPELERRRFVSSFIPAVWNGGDAAAARTYFVDRREALPSFRPEVSFALVHDIAKAGVSAASWRLMESAVRSNVQQITPGFASVIGVHAIEACRAGTKSRAERAACISNAIKLENLTATP